MVLKTPDKIRNLQRKLYLKAKSEPEFRFYVLYDKIYREDILIHAYRLAKANRGSAGTDGVTFDQIASEGVTKWLTGIREQLLAKIYRPQPVRRVMIPKPGAGSAHWAFPPYVIGWFKRPPNWSLSRSSRRTWNPMSTVIDPNAVR